VIGWAILRTGREATSLDVPGSAQALADGVPHGAVASLVVGPPWDGHPARWTGAPCELLVRDDAPWLGELARAVAAALSSQAHEVTPRHAPASEITSRRASRAYSLMLDTARPAGPGARGVLLGLATADDPATAMALARHPPLGDLAPRVVTRTLRVGVIGEVRAQGGLAPGVVLPRSRCGRGIDWGSAFRARS
jgi:hypothetical protein